MTTSLGTPPASPAAADDTGGTPPTAEATLDLILHTLIPCLLLSSLSVAAFHGRWRALRDKLGHLRSSLTDAACFPAWSRHPLLLDLLPALLAALRSLRSLSDRCHDPSLPGGKLLLQSDLDMATSSLSLRLHDLDLLIRSGLLQHCPPPSEEAAGDGENSNAIVLSQPGESASKEDTALFVRDLFARLQIGGVEFKRKALDSLVNLLSGEAEEVVSKNAAIIAREGDIPRLVHLLEPSSCVQPAIREQAVAAVSSLATASEASRKAIFEEGVLGPLLRLLETGSTPLREKAASAVDAITADPANAWAITAYGGVQVLIEACRPSGSHVVRAHASGSLRNVAAAVVDARVAMVDEGAVPVLLELVSSSASGSMADDEEARKNAVECLCILASAGSENDRDGEKMRACVIQEGGLQKLLQLFRETAASGSSAELTEHLLRAIHALSASPAARRVLSASVGLLLQLAELIKHGNPRMQQISATLLCELTPGEEIKRSIGGCMGALLKLMESSKPANSQEVAAQVLVSLLAVRANRKELSRDEKSLTRLVGLLDPANDRIRKELPLSVVMALASGGGGCRKRVAEMGACLHLQKLAEADVPGAKKALQRITGGRIKSIFSSIAWRE